MKVEIQLESRKFIECYERFYSKEEQRFIAVDVEKKFTMILLVFVDKIAFLA